MGIRRRDIPGYEQRVHGAACLLIANGLVKKALMESVDPKGRGYALGSTIAPFFGIAFLRDRRGMKDACFRLLGPEVADKRGAQHRDSMNQSGKT